ncbi:hypothetical protein GCM10009691_28830 [Brevibacterium picturae]|uniref:Uncharacterized protein n=1 Tax=Brevibacterium picturae TaxID=260553 RepID=A0ABP4N154_9MICO
MAVMISSTGHIQIGARVAHIPAVKERLRMAAALARTDSRCFARRSRAMSLVGAAVVGVADAGAAVGVVDAGAAGECAGSVDSSTGSVDRLGAWGSSG